VAVVQYSRRDSAADIYYLSPPDACIDRARAEPGRSRRLPKPKAKKKSAAT